MVTTMQWWLCMRTRLSRSYLQTICRRGLELVNGDRSKSSCLSLNLAQESLHLNRIPLQQYGRRVYARYHEMVLWWQSQESSMIFLSTKNRVMQSSAKACAETRRPGKLEASAGQV